MSISVGLSDNPWPRDMVITVDDFPSTLMLLLFVRSAWQLDDNGVPPLESQPQPGSTRAPADLDRAAANARWAADWARASEVVAPDLARISLPDAATRLLLDDDLSVDELLYGVSTEAFWRVGLDGEAEWRWLDGLRRPWVASGSSPEHDAVDWLVVVWRSGLRTIVELPFAGYYVRRLSRECVVVSMATRRDPQLYSIALSTL